MVRNLNQIDEFIFENLQNLSFCLKLQKNRETLRIVDVMSFLLDEFLKSYEVIEYYVFLGNLFYLVE